MHASRYSSQCDLQQPRVYSTVSVHPQTTRKHIVCVCVYVCVCPSTDDQKTHYVCVCVCPSTDDRKTHYVCVCVCPSTDNWKTHCVCVCTCVHVRARVLSPAQLFAAPWTVAHQAPLSIGLSRKNTGVGCSFLLWGIFLPQGSKTHLLCLEHWQADSLPLTYLESHIYTNTQWTIAQP